MSEAEYLPALTEERIPGLTYRRAKLVELMVFGAKSRDAAADEIGMSRRGARGAFKSPVVVRHYREQLAILRESERARNITRAVELREQSSNMRVALDAARFLEGEQRPGVTVNVGVSVQTPGYILAVPHDREAIEDVLRQAGSSRSILDHRGEGS